MWALVNIQNWLPDVILADWDMRGPQQFDEKQSFDRRF